MCMLEISRLFKEGWLMLSSNFSAKHRAIIDVVEDSVRVQVIGMGDDVDVVNSMTRLEPDAVLILRFGVAGSRRLND